MEEFTPTYEYEPEAPAAKPKMAPWLIVVLILLGVCVALVFIPVCVIVVLALLGPVIGDVFSNIVTSLQ
jgi:hypothetical protein